jgi:hypothetical protein
MNFETIQKKAMESKPQPVPSTVVDDINFEEEDDARPIHNPNYFMNALPAGDNGGIADNLDVGDIDQVFYQGAGGFGEPPGADEGQFDIGNIGQIG